MNPFKWLWRKIFKRKKLTYFLDPEVKRQIPGTSYMAALPRKIYHYDFCQICETDKPKDILFRDFVGWICSSCKHIICSKCLQMIKDAKGPIECSWWGCSSNEDKVDESEPLKKVAYILEKGTSEDYNKLKDALATVTAENSMLVKAIDQVVVGHIDEKKLKFLTAAEYEQWEKIQFAKYMSDPQATKIDLYGTLKRKGPLRSDGTRGEWS